jgi:hypothetical protein
MGAQGGNVPDYVHEAVVDHFRWWTLGFEGGC